MGAGYFFWFFRFVWAVQGVTFLFRVFLWFVGVHAFRSITKI